MWVLAHQQPEKVPFHQALNTCAAALLTEPVVEVFAVFKVGKNMSNGVSFVLFFVGTKHALAGFNLLAYQLNIATK